MPKSLRQWRLILLVTVLLLAAVVSARIVLIQPTTHPSLRTYSKDWSIDVSDMGMWFDTTADGKDVIESTTCTEKFASNAAKMFSAATGKLVATIKPIGYGWRSLACLASEFNGIVYMPYVSTTIQQSMQIIAYGLNAKHLWSWVLPPSLNTVYAIQANAYGAYVLIGNGTNLIPQTEPTALRLVRLVDGIASFSPVAIGSSPLRPVPDLLQFDGGLVLAYASDSQQSEIAYVDNTGTVSKALHINASITSLRGTIVRTDGGVYARYSDLQATTCSGESPATRSIQQYAPNGSLAFTYKLPFACTYINSINVLPDGGTIIQATEATKEEPTVLVLIDGNGHEAQFRTPILAGHIAVDANGLVLLEHQVGSNIEIDKVNLKNGGLTAFKSWPIKTTTGKSAMAGFFIGPGRVYAIVAHSNAAQHPSSYDTYALNGFLLPGLGMSYPS